MDPVRKGATVTVADLGPVGQPLRAGQYPGRSAAWQFVRFALGGPAPQFADTVRLLVSGSVPRAFMGAEVSDRQRWGEAFDLIADAAHQTGPTGSGMSLLRVDLTIPPAVWCGVPRPAGTGERRALRFQILTGAPGGTGVCALTVDIYQSGSVIDTVVVYTPKGR